MPTREEQEIEIERMRARLHELVTAKVGNMIDPEVGKLSTKLDMLIVKYQQTKDKDSK
ncbi:MAG: Spo0E like sporulation regulatory protein [Firmicutes bacterium]|nr:Spo0E like sporulation regulatory protein [Bacillota bacterium]